MSVKPADLDYFAAAELSIGEDGIAFDELGCGPYPLVPPCPNCGRGGGYLDTFTYEGLLNSGYQFDGCCSRRCELQHEHAAKLAAERQAG